MTPPGEWGIGHSTRWVGYESLCQMGGVLVTLPVGWGSGLHNGLVGHKQNNDFDLKLILM